MRKHLTTVILVILLLAGVSLLLYPTVSDYWNSFHQTQAIASYTEQVADLDQVDYDKLIKDAREYNRELAEKPARYVLTEDERARYNSLLDVAGHVHIREQQPLKLQYCAHDKHLLISSMFSD